MEKVKQQSNFTYKNENSRHKKHTRNFIVDKLKELSLDPIHYCGLPALSPVLEEYLLANYQDLKMFLAEGVKPLVFKEQKKMFKGKAGVYQEIVHYYGNLLTAPIGFRLNLIWFDLCGMLTRDTLDQMFSFFQQNALMSKGLFAITWSACREKGNQTNLYSQLQDRYGKTSFESLKDFKHNQLPEIFVKMLSEASGQSFKSEFSYQYKDRGTMLMQFNALSWGT